MLRESTQAAAAQGLGARLGSGSANDSEERRTSQLDQRLTEPGQLLAPRGAAQGRNESAVLMRSLDTTRSI